MHGVFDLHIVDDFLDAATCLELTGQLADADAGAATVYGASAGGSIDENMRKTKRLVPPQKTLDDVMGRLSGELESVGKRFGMTLTIIEEPQFLRYNVGDFFVAHQDGNTGLMRSEREQSRKISVLVFLNSQTESPDADGHCGGTLVFTEWRPSRQSGRLEVPAKAGTLVAFPSDLTHEVIPVTHGTRYSIATWFG